MSRRCFYLCAVELNKVSFKLGLMFLAITDLLNLPNPLIVSSYWTVQYASNLEHAQDLYLQSWNALGRYDAFVL